MTHNAPTLRDYQQHDVAEIREQFRSGAARVCYQAPTGSGKTVLFTYIVAGATARGKRVIIFAHRDEIVRQISEALSVLGVTHGMIAAGYPAAPAAVQVANVATLVRRLDKVEAPDLLVVDECHHSVAGSWRAIIDRWPETKVLGVSATPERLDGKGLNAIFDALVRGPTVSELIQQGYLSPFTAFAPARSPDLTGVQTRAGDYAVDQLSTAMSKAVVIGGAVDEYTKLCPGVPAVAFCVDIAHSKLVAERFVARGYRAAHVDGETDPNERRDLIGALGSGQVQVLCNCGLISEGLDVPGVTAVLLLRPTKSLTLYMQQVGRALRPGKERAFILDHAGNTYRFGMVDKVRQWSLTGRAKKEGEPRLCRCENCGALNEYAATHCQNCGAALPKGKLEVELEEINGGPLLEVNDIAAMRYSEAIEWAGSNLNRLRLVAAARGYNSRWIAYAVRDWQSRIALREEG